MNRQQSMWSRRNLYHLKRRFGTVVDFYHVSGVTVDVETGETVTIKEKYKIKRGILLPTTLGRYVNIAGATSRVTPSLPTSEIDLLTRFLIIDQEDLPTGLQLDEDDYFIIDGKRYNAMELVELEDDVAVLFKIRHMKGSVRHAIFKTVSRDSIALNENSSGTKL